MATNNGQHGQPEPTDRRRLIASVGWSLLIFVSCLFLPAGTWSWVRGWLFILVVVAASIVITMYLQRVNPDVVAARVNRHDGTKRWDFLLGVIFILPTMLAMPDCGSSGRRAISLVSLTVVGLCARLCRLSSLAWLA